jgi:hypothetical protein
VPLSVTYATEMGVTPIITYSLTRPSSAVWTLHYELLCINILSGNRVVFLGDSSAFFMDPII